MIKRLTILVLVLVVLIDLTLAIFLAESTLHPHRKGLTSTNLQRARLIADKYDYQLKDVQISAVDRSKLHGWYFQKTSRVVLLLHGQADNRAGMLSYAELFLKNGFSVLVPDSRAHGESEGLFATYGILEADDIHQWVNFLVEQKSTEIYGLGESMGAAILLASLEKENRFAAVIAESSFCNFKKIASDRLGNGLLAGFLLNPAFLYARIRYGVDLTSVNPARVAAKTNTPIFLIHGIKDSSISPKHSYEIAQARDNITLWIVPDTRHTASIGTHPAEFEQRVISFLARAEARNAGRMPANINAGRMPALIWGWRK